MGWFSLLQTEPRLLTKPRFNDTTVSQTKNAVKQTKNPDAKVRQAVSLTQAPDCSFNSLTSWSNDGYGSNFALGVFRRADVQITAQSNR